jgi:hypothetical protein
MAADRASSHPYISTITNVREVALMGAADLPYWRDRLQPEGLTPFVEDGRAALLLTAIESKFRGIPFRELSVSIRVSDEDGAASGGAFLAYAFNSSRLLSLAERILFQTPYHLADLTVDENMPASMAVSVEGRTLFSARMTSSATLAQEENSLFEGPIYLPGGTSLFYARLSGASRIYHFDLLDTVTINPRENDTIFAQLIESNFRGKAWLLRAGAVHVRSKTYRRER